MVAPLHYRVRLIQRTNGNRRQDLMPPRSRVILARMRYVAYAVDLSGVVHATYEMECLDDAEAKERARQYLEAHPVVKVWKGPRRVARLTQDRDAIR
jgi:hypothetical protein